MSYIHTTVQYAKYDWIHVMKPWEDENLRRFDSGFRNICGAAQRKLAGIWRNLEAFTND